VAAPLSTDEPIQLATSGVNVALLGYGTVGKALHSLLESRRGGLVREHGIDPRVTGVASRRLGWIADDKGLEQGTSAGTVCDDLRSWLEASRADVMFECIALDPQSGQPALDYTRTALQLGIHVVSANKGPVVHGYRELTSIAHRNNCGYRFESAVMDGAPVFSLVRECLPLAELTGIRGVFTSTATVVLEAIERGGTLDAGIRHAQQLGIAESGPGYDVDGWDSAVKLCALANVLMDGYLRPGDVERTGIRELDVEDVRRCAAAGTPIRLMGEVMRENGHLHARVRPEQCAADGPFGVVRGATLVTHFEADVFPGGLTVTSRDPDPMTTAYGLLSDLVSLTAR
jgi:homoserine dehydrogenase